MEDVPAIVFIVDTKNERIAVSEANRVGIPIIGVVDTNCDPDQINYPIPGNDDALRAIELYARFIGDAVLKARSEVTEGESMAPSGGDAAVRAESAEAAMAVAEPALAPRGES
jgi:small subunit ribosomal protein S2